MQQSSLMVDMTGAAEVGDVLERFGTWLRRVTPRQEWNVVGLGTLSLCCRRGPLRLGDLATSQGISQPGMTGLVSRLADAGLVTKEPDPTDGRATLITATEAGQAYLRTVHRARADLVTEHVRQLTAEQQAALVGALDALAVLADLPVEEAIAGRITGGIAGG